MSFISFFKASVTRRCCFTVVSPLNSTLSTFTSYISPQPLDMSTTSMVFAKGNFFSNNFLICLISGDSITLKVPKFLMGLNL
ncbi:UNVERIFIED_CONTAM: hypothetical protein PYX00_009212 [Menopon gallinae]|uniref:Uncharacterized protein n=1 Tax=Menopon gallinae TaxID=328185 RepID=A0AAW2HAD7_9NEOP